MTRWRNCKLGDVLTLQRGFDLPERERRPGHVPIVSSSGITGYHDEARAAAPGVVTGRYGTLGEVFFIREPYWPLNTALWVKDFKSNDERFVSYLLRTLSFGRQNAAGAVPGVNRNHLHALDVRVPDPVSQRRIGEFLATYDDLIENNTKRIKILEEMARSLYREWFVEFRFPAHRASDKAMQRLPPGWTLVQIADLVEQGLAQVTTGPFGTQLHASDYVEHGTPVINVRNIGFGSIRSEKLEYVNDATVARLNQHVLAEGDIVFGRKGAVERHVLVGRSEVGWFQGSDCLRLRLRANAGTSPRLLSQQFLLEDHKQWMKNQGSHAATMASLNQAIIGRIPVLLPPPEILHRADEELGALTNFSARLREANQVLQSTRDLLLPRLVSGEIELHP